jgi:hypothetical protein
MLMIDAHDLVSFAPLMLFVYLYRLLTHDDNGEAPEKSKNKKNNTIIHSLFFFFFFFTLITSFPIFLLL